MLAERTIKLHKLAIHISTRLANLGSQLFHILAIEEDSRQNEHNGDQKTPNLPVHTAIIPRYARGPIQPRRSSAKGLSQLSREFAFAYTG